MFHHRIRMPFAVTKGNWWHTIRQMTTRMMDRHLSWCQKLHFTLTHFVLTSIPENNNQIFEKQSWPALALLSRSSTKQLGSSINTLQRPFHGPKSGGTGEEERGYLRGGGSAESETAATFSVGRRCNLLTRLKVGGLFLKNARTFPVPYKGCSE